MEITRIQQQQRKRNRYNIFIDYKYAFSITGNDLINCHLKKGPIDRNRLDYLLECATIGILYEYSVSYETRRPHSKQEHIQYLYKKATALNVPDDKKQPYIEKAIKKLIKNGYQNDKDFTNWFISQRINSTKPKGRNAITQELLRKGINSDTISKALLETLDNKKETQNAQILANKKKEQIKKLDPHIANYELEKKIKRYLLSRGYTYNVIKCIQLI